MAFFYTKWTSQRAKTVDDVEYNNSKMLYRLLKMCNLSDLNDLYNAQDVFFLCEFIEKRFQTRCNVSGGYIPRKINSASKMSRSIQREKYKVILALPTNNSIMETFEKILTGGFSSVNARFSFDIEILMPNYIQSEYDKMKIDKSFLAYKRDYLKVIYKIRFDGQTTYEPRQVISKILKLDENNQYGYAMTKSMPTGCIKNIPHRVPMFDNSLEIFKTRSKTTKGKGDSSSDDVESDTSSCNDNERINDFGKKTTRDRFIVMDDVSDLADKSEKFTSFLTVARKFNYTCVYIFHIIYHENTIWRMILSLTNIFSNFPASVSLSHMRRMSL